MLVSLMMICIWCQVILITCIPSISELFSPTWWIWTSFQHHIQSWQKFHLQVVSRSFCRSTTQAHYWRSHDRFLTLLGTVVLVHFRQTIVLLTLNPCQPLDLSHRLQEGYQRHVYLWELRKQLQLPALSFLSHLWEGSTKLVEIFFYQKWFDDLASRFNFQFLYLCSSR